MTDTAAALKGRLGDREWRLDNLYFIQDAKGDVVRFVRNRAQRKYWAGMWYRNVILKARQLGFSTLIVMDMLDGCLFNSNTQAGIIDQTIDDAKLKLKKAKFAYDRLPAALQAAIPLLKDNTEELEWRNGSSIRVGTSHRGGTLQDLHVSEYGAIAAAAPDKAIEIKSGAFGAVHAGNFIHVESTAKGNGGEFHDLVMKSEALKKQNRQPSELEFKFHFFPWWEEESYRLNPNAVVVIAEVAEYFEVLEKEHRIALDPSQRAWYQAQRNLIGPDEILREYPSIPEESFKSSIEGAFFKREMGRMRADGRIGPLPHDPTRPVNTFWDIGHNDPNFIIFHQTDGLRHRIIDVYENDQESLSHCVAVLKERKDRFGYDYGKHIGPHDLMNHDWSAEPGKTRSDIAADKGVKFDVVPRPIDIGDAIEVARRFLAMTWIDESRGARLIRCLDNFRREWDERRSTWRREYLHDWASHGASALITGALGYHPERKSSRRPLDGGSEASPWAA